MISKIENNNTAFGMNVFNYGVNCERFAEISKALKENPYTNFLERSYRLDARAVNEGCNHMSLSLSCYEKPQEKTTKLGKFIEKIHSRLAEPEFTVTHEGGIYNNGFIMYLDRPWGFWFTKGQIGKSVNDHNVDLSGDKGKEIWCWGTCANICDDLIKALDYYCKSIEHAMKSGNKKALYKGEQARYRAEDMLYGLKDLKYQQREIVYKEALDQRIAKGDASKIEIGTTHDLNSSTALPKITLSGKWDFDDLPNSFSCRPID